MSATVQSAIFAAAVKPFEKLKVSRVRMVAHLGNVVLYATGPSFDIRVTIPATVDESFETTLPPAMMANCSAVTLGQGKLKFTYDALEHTVTVAGDSMDATLRTLDPFNDYAWPDIPGASFPPEVLDMIERLAYATSSGASAKENLKGVFLLPDRLLATDSYRLHQIASTGIPGSKVVIPSIALPILALVDEAESVYLTPRWARAESARVCVTVALNDSTGPNSDQIDNIIRSSRAEVGIDFSKERIKAFRALMSTSTDENRRIEFRRVDDSIVASMIEREQRYEVALDVDIIGEPEFPYLVNGKRFVDMIERASGPVVSLRWKDRLKPSIVETGSEVLVMMPLRTG